MRHISLWLLLLALSFVQPLHAQVSTVLTPVADAYVRNGSFSATNYGVATGLETKSANASGFTRFAYFKFALPGFAGTIQSAT